MGSVAGGGARVDASVSALSPVTIHDQNDGVSPPPLEYAGLAYDTTDGYALLFGGINLAGNAVATTWEFHDGNWTNLTSVLTQAPAARWGAAIGYDPVDQEVVLFGGCVSLGCSPSLNDTWGFAHGRWTDLTPTAGAAPAARGMTQFTYDAADGYMLLFGGAPVQGSTFPFDDTWSFVGGQWRLLSPNPVGLLPPNRFDGILAYDAAVGSAILFGGVGTTGLLDDTWSFQAGNWTELSPGQGTGPSGRRAMDGAYDAADGYLLLVGGYATGTVLSDTWTFGSSGWVRTYPTGSTPTPIYAAAVTYDTVDGFVLLFSGGASTSRVYTGTLAYSGGTWSILVSPPGTPIDWTGVLFAALFAPILLVIVQVLVVVSQWARFRRDVRGFDLPPGTPVTWLPPIKWFRSQAAGMLVVPILLLVFLFPLTLLSGSAFAAAEFVLFLFLGVPLLIVWAVLFWVALRQAAIRRVGLTAAGVVIQRGKSELRIPWNLVQPSTMILPQRKGWFLFHYTRPPANRPATFALPYAHAKTLIESPYAPAWILSPLVVQTLGLPAARGLMPATPMATTVAPTPSPSPAGSTPIYPAPPAPPPPPSGYAPATYPAPPSYTASSAPLRSETPPPPPPVLGGRTAPSGPQVQCPKCRGVFPRYAYVFCPTCGTRLA